MSPGEELSFSHTVILLLREILDQQRAQLQVQKAQLCAFGGQTQENAVDVKGVDEKLTAQSNDDKLKAHFNADKPKTPSSDDVVDQGLDVSHLPRTIPSKKSQVSIRSHASEVDVSYQVEAVFRSLSRPTLSEMLAIDSWEEHQLSAFEVIRSLRMKSLYLDWTLDDKFIVLSASLLFIQVALVCPLWRVWTREFGIMGPTLQLLHQMDCRGFPWMSLLTSIRLCNTVSALLNISNVLVWYSFYADGSLHTQKLLKDDETRYAQIMGRVSGVIDVCGFFSQTLWYWVAPIHIWMVYMVACLHRHDLLCYAGAMVRAFEVDLTTSKLDIVPALKKLEVVVTARLRLASARWILIVVFYTICLCVIALIFCMFLFTSIDISYQQLLTFSVVTIFGFLFIVALIGPLAMVAETYQYDVLRALNNPVILKAAQVHVGQQLLRHLENLDWGFRVGGATITAKLVANVAMAVLVTMVTSVSQAAFSRTQQI